MIPLVSLRGALRSALAISLLLAPSLACAETSWPRLPSDAEIDTARTRLVEERTFRHEDCAAQCTGDNEVAVMTCRARECMDRCRLGPEVVDSALTQIETIKAHRPLDPDPLSSAQVFALTTTTVTRDNCNGRIWTEIVYAIEALAYRDSGWYWSVQRYGLETRQQDASNKAQRDAEFASYFGPGRFQLGFPETAGAFADPYRVTVNANDTSHPLRLLIFVERLRPSTAPQAQPQQPVYEPAADIRVSLGATSYAGNEGRLALYLDSRDCRNCVDEFVDGRSVQRMADFRQPILLQTDAYGYARIELFLDFAALNASGQLSPASGLMVPLQIGVLAPPAPGEPERLLKEVRFESRLQGIGVVEAIYFQPSRAPGDPRLQLTEVPLSEYLDDAGTRDGERVLRGSDRVKVKRHGEALILEPGSAPGATLRAGHVLQVGDLISVNACGTDSRPIINGLPAGLPAQIWVAVRFFDGLRGRFGVNAQVCRSALTVGRSRNDSGFLTPAQRFIYWAADQGIDAAIVKLLGPAKVVTVAREVLGWVSLGLGYEATYLILNSAVAVESSANGSLRISTRQGEPRVLTARSGDDGVAVPAGMTASVVGDDASVEVTDSERGALADQWLAALAASVVPANSPPAKDASSADDTPASFGPDLPYPSADNPDNAPLAAIGLVLVAVVIFAIWLGKRRIARSRSAPMPRRRARKAASACPGCGQPANRGARFCGNCGKQLG
jgi:hypothetical protein